MFIKAKLVPYLIARITIDPNNTQIRRDFAEYKYEYDECVWWNFTEFDVPEMPDEIISKAEALLHDNTDSFVSSADPLISEMVKNYFDTEDEVYDCLDEEVYEIIDGFEVSIRVAVAFKVYANPEN